MSLQDREIVLGVTGGIAAYKAVEVLRRLVQQGANVHVVMTRSAQEFVGPLTFQTLARNPVITEMFALTQETDIQHISLARRADLVLIAPATANVIGKFAHGIADDFLTTLLLATRAPILMAPAMNPEMYANGIVQDNIASLRARQVRFIPPGAGETACNEVGVGRLAEVSAIVEAVERFFLQGRDLVGKKVLVTAGPTEEPLDPVRFLSNPSSGKMGYALAEASQNRGAQVVLVSGPTLLAPPPNVDFYPIKTALEMRATVMRELESSDVVIKAAAVADYRPKTMFTSKIKKREGELVVQLERNPDILAEIGSQKRHQVLVGFAAETDDLLANARAKVLQKNLDMIVANNVRSTEIGFRSNENKVLLIYPDGSIEDLPKMSKREVADAILDRVVELVRRRAGADGTRP